jgi:hypothetical protein
MNEIQSTTYGPWLAPLYEMWMDISGHAPKVVAAFVVLLAGLVLAWMVRAMAKALFKWFRLDARLREAWIFRFWPQGARTPKPSDTISNACFYLVMFLAVLLSIRLLGVSLGQTILASLLGVIPRVFSFMLILFLGSILAVFFSLIAHAMLASSGIQHSALWSRIVAWGTFGVTVMFSLEQLGLAGQFLTLLVLIVFGTAGLAAALAFGMGCKDIAREFLIEMLKEDRQHGK